MDRSKLLTLDNLKAAFVQFDTNGNGLIDNVELKNALAFNPLLRKCPKHLESTLTNIMSKYDANNDG